jgi:hypothetical protein
MMLVKPDLTTDAERGRRSVFFLCCASKALIVVSGVLASLSFALEHGCGVDVD